MRYHQWSPTPLPSVVVVVERDYFSYIRFLPPNVTWFHALCSSEQTRVYDEDLNTWLNVTKNYTVYGNWTRTTTQEVTIDGVGQAVDSAISPNGKYFATVSGYFPTTTNYGGYSCQTVNNECEENKGYIAIFRRDPSDGSLLFIHSER